MADHVDEDRPVVPPRWRDYLYPIATAAIPLAAVYGLISQETVPLYIALAAAFLGTATATAYRPSRTLDS